MYCVAFNLYGVRNNEKSFIAIMERRFGRCIYYFDGGYFAHHVAFIFIRLEFMALTDQQIIEKARDFMAKNPNCSRAALRTVCQSSYERLEKLSVAGAFKMPIKCPKGKAHLYKQDDHWRKFRLWGSPTNNKRIKPNDKTK